MMFLAPLSISLALVTWADVAVAPSKADRANSFQRSLAGLDRPSERTVETLKRFALDGKYRRDPADVLATLGAQVRANPDADLVYALAELSWVEAKRLERRHRAESIDRTIDTLSYAHDYLFGPELAHARQPSDPRYRLACDLYNGSLDRLLKEAQANGGKIEANGEFSLKAKGREQVFKVVLTDSPWAADDVDQIILASAFEVSGLPTLNYQYGLGVPLIAVRRSDKKPEGVERFYPPEMGFPLTAFVTPPSKLRGPTRRERGRTGGRAGRPAPDAQRRRAADADRVGPDDAAGLHVVAVRPEPVPLDGVAAPGPERRARRPDADPPVRAGQDPGGDGPRPGVEPAGLGGDGQRPPARPPGPGALPVHALHVPHRHPRADRRRRAPRDPGRGRADVPDARRQPRPGVQPDGPARAQHGGPAQPRDGGRQRPEVLGAEYLRPDRRGSRGRPR